MNIISIPVSEQNSNVNRYITTLRCEKETVFPFTSHQFYL